ncbi:putative Uncharacterized short-chain type dehydrogenase/reductase y4mP [metagenome]|uniref:Putative Uncharacterized short-chain type dehydrogenase/reductase y4mP n=1 Tax=metagenome TaxID=256318 RepID=A0A2P2C0H0_9ZZZZ
MTDIDFTSGTVALVTGAGGGIGAVTARRFAEAGADVALVDLRAEPVSGLAEELATDFPGRRFVGLAANVTAEGDLLSLRAQVADALGSVNHLAIVAGTVQEPSPTAELSADEWDRVFAVNARGAFLTAKTFIPQLTDAPGNTITAIASHWAKMNPAMFAAYSASKAVVFSLCRTLAVELAPHGVRVNAVAPGSINTDMHQTALVNEAKERGISFEEMRDIDWGKIPLGHAGDPESIADAVVFLSSSAARYMTGATLDVNGGTVFS